MPVMIMNRVEEGIKLISPSSSVNNKEFKDGLVKLLNPSKACNLLNIIKTIRLPVRTSRRKLTLLKSSKFQQKIEWKV